MRFTAPWSSSSNAPTGSSGPKSKNPWEWHPTAIKAGHCRCSCRRRGNSSKCKRRTSTHNKPLPKSTASRSCKNPAAAPASPNPASPAPAGVRLGLSSLSPLLFRGGPGEVFSTLGNVRGLKHPTLTLPSKEGRELRLQILQQLPPRHKPLAALLVDVEGGEEVLSQRRPNGLQGGRRGAF